ncbi:UDP-glucose dehydrogenase family protein [Effusibacillus lacus]|uniref:UDP-glucose 6-dehydrogenase n=1 Tax=Effusibacillus lacus TaxID=1348429 RepID=A0A292YU70_9BACL|nr:UDP-glucose/GDP-mannose dehydrogenase family protein [Effusibacillus lacus]TCS73499.1 UDPglucose 6-dehydrogenase [Effusibacillus lacus]GAX92004.1 UDP-glucose/GDP-mannose dehydrogenase family protein [Effusibacillus lacus]
MKITVIGSGYVGTTTAIVLASMHHQVISADVDRGKVEKLRRGVLPFVESGLDKLLCEMHGSGQLEFTSNIEAAIRDGQVIIITVGTPSLPDGRADLRYLQTVADTIAGSINEYKVIAVKSTVPVGTNRWLSEYLAEKIGTAELFDVVSNPEFLREGSALYDTLHPERTVLGGNSSRAMAILQEIYKPLDSGFILTDWETAELIKYASNAFLATKISFINEVARTADQVGADVTTVARGMGMDTRIGSQFLKAGIGYGGSCFPKDVKALIHTAKELGIDPKILEAVEAVNRTQTEYYLNKLTDVLLANAKKPWTIAVLGLTFKPDTDDQRESPAIRMVEQLLEHCIEIRILDPTIQMPTQTPWPDEPKIAVCSTIEETLSAADAAILCTEWEQFGKINWKETVPIMRHPILLDGRNYYEPEHMKAAGIHYIAVGRRS